MDISSQNFDALLSSVATMVSRMTPSIRAILLVLHVSPGPISVPDMLGKLVSRKVMIDKVTVYRKLELLLSLGVIQEVLLSGEKKYYELVRGHHHHLVCLSCDQVTDWVPDESVLKRETKHLKKQGFRVMHHSLELFGVCKQCG